jgi:hypothetical protein
MSSKRTNKAEQPQPAVVQDLQVEELEERIAPAGVIIERR